MFPFAAIVSSVRKLKTNNSKTKKTVKEHPIHTVSKEQYYQWLSEGKCGSCGADSGEFQGICDECRWS